jgi:AcrR family transcriptional regulator
MGIPERRERERQARRTLVLSATRELVREHGFNGTTTRQIAEKCELSEATLFWYFQSKDEIFGSLLLEGIELMSKGLAEIASSKATPAQKVTRVWSFFGHVRSAHPEYFHVFSSLAHPHSTAGFSDELKSEIARRSGDNIRAFVEILRELVGPEDARVCADVFWSTYVGLVVLRDSRQNLGARPHPGEKELKRVLQILLRGMTR